MSTRNIYYCNYKCKEGEDLATDSTNEVIAVKNRAMFMILMVCGIILILASIVCFIASALNEFDFGFLCTCISMACAGTVIISLALRTKKLPTELILANDSCFILPVIGVEIPFSSVILLRTRHDGNSIIIFIDDQNSHIVDYVSKYKETANRIAKIVEEKTGHIITVTK